MSKEETFKVRAYGYGELAQLYFPNISKQSATVQFRRWIVVNEKLQEALIDSGFKKFQKLLTPKQVDIITKFIGEP
jgi:hypothetical protein